ncbi:hypothetical protein EC968_009154, partial [Mortierella alpina]
ATEGIGDASRRTWESRLPLDAPEGLRRDITKLDKAITAKRQQAEDRTERATKQIMADLKTAWTICNKAKEQSEATYRKHFKRQPQKMADCLADAQKDCDEQIRQHQASSQDRINRAAAALQVRLSAIEEEAATQYHDLLETFPVRERIRQQRIHEAKQKRLQEQEAARLAALQQQLRDEERAQREAERERQAVIRAPRLAEQARRAAINMARPATRPHIPSGQMFYRSPRLQSLKVTPPSLAPL